MRSVPVTKMHGTRNDFVVLDQRPPTLDQLEEFAKRVCDRRSGIGADGLLVLLASESADIRVRIINADGSEAEMCGNGIRCVVRFLADRDEGHHFRIETLAGPIVADLLKDGDIRLNMGVPVFENRTIAVPNAFFVSMGNPHLVIFESSWNDIDVSAAGRSNSGFNVHVAQVRGAQNLRVRHFERGVGLTQSCGTGAVACAAAAIRAGMAKSPVRVTVPGGVLQVEWDGTHEAFLTGPAETVFHAQYVGS